jgi:hypothetical protein
LDAAEIACAVIEDAHHRSISAGESACVTASLSSKGVGSSGARPQNRRSAWLLPSI